MGYLFPSKREERKTKIKEALTEGAKSFSDLFREVAKCKVEKYKVGWEEREQKISGYSKSYLITYLRELQQDGIIGKNKKGKYVLLKRVFEGKYEVFQKSFSFLKNRKAKLPELLKEISEWDDPQEILYMKIENKVLYYLKVYLSMVEITVNAPRKLQDLSMVLLSHSTYEFLHILSACGNKDVEVTNSVLQQIKDNLVAM